VAMNNGDCNQLGISSGADVASGKEEEENGDAPTSYIRPLFAIGSQQYMLVSSRWLALASIDERWICLFVGLQ
jgi:hypothetical protein